MLLQTVFLILFLIIFGQIYGDDCNSDLDLSLSYWFEFEDKNVTMDWGLRSPTDCPVEYHLTVTDYDLGVIQDIQTEETSSQIEPISPCVPYAFNLRAVNKAFPTVEGPSVTMTIDFSRRVQIAPLLYSVAIQATSINMTFTLEGNANRCPLINLYVDGGNYFNQSMSLQDLPDPAPTNVTVEIRSLLPNTMYYLQVYVENNAGLSPPTGLAVQTLELSDRIHL